MKVRSVLGLLHDSQSTAEARRYAQEVARRRAEDEGAISEYLTCGHVDWVEVLTEELNRGAS